MRALSTLGDLEEIADKVSTLFEQLSVHVPGPIAVSHEDGKKLQYAEKSNEQLILLKCARQISSFYAMIILLGHGFLQDQGAIQRILDEIHDDILYIFLGMKVGPWTPHHDVYVKAFWSDIDEKIPRTSREKIISYISQHASAGDVDAMRQSSRSIHRAYSSYVHANAIASAELFNFGAKAYDLKGSTSPSLRLSHERDAWNYAYRLVTSINFAAMLIDPDTVGKAAYAYRKLLETRYGRLIFS